MSNVTPKIVTLTILIVLIAHVERSTQITQVKDTLQLVQVFFRHGGKSPEFSYPNDPYANESNWPLGWNQLTNKGKNELYQDGLYLRELYDGFISTDYLRDEVTIVSSATDRTMMSAMALLFGFYRDYHKKAQWKDNIKWEPIPVHTIPKEVDRYLHLTEPCAYLQSTETEMTISPNLLNKLFANDQEILDHIRENSGFANLNLYDLNNLFDALLAQEDAELPLPEWTNQLFKNSVFMNFKNEMWKIVNEIEQWRRLRAGPLLEKLVANMDSKINGKEDDGSFKMRMFSGHDRTLADLIYSLDLRFEGTNIPFGSVFIIELHEKVNSESDDQKREPFVEMFYRNNTDGLPYTINLSVCGNPCTLTKFKELARRHQPTAEEWTIECNNPASKF